MVAHGTLSRYNNHGCRCEPCMDAMRTYRAEYAARKAAGAPTRRYRLHGTLDTYDDGCRCRRCRTLEPKEPARTPVPAEPLFQLIRDLYGTELVDDRIAELCGVARETIGRWRKSGRIRHRDIDRIAIKLGRHPAEIWGTTWWIETTQLEGSTT